MLELLRWEIAEGNETTVRTAMLREMHTFPLAKIYEEKFKDIDISAISALIIGGIYYLNLHRDRSKFDSGIPYILSSPMPFPYVPDLVLYSSLYPQTLNDLDGD